jgi:cytochrome P450
MHQSYGEVVRIGPNELSFSNREAWNEIYGHRIGKPNMQKDEDMYTPPLFGPKSIITADDAGHARYRRLLAHAFSDKALRAQEPMLVSYVDLLIRRINELCDGGSNPLDMVKWYNFTTFDLIGELSFGESFHCLENSAYHPWVDMMFGGIKINSYFNAMKKFPGAEKLLAPFVPKKLLDAKKVHMEYVVQKVATRLAMKNEKPDFTHFFLRNQEKDPLTEPELQTNADILVVAGSETTATLLSGVSYHLCHNPTVYKKLVDEVRGAFKSDEEITITGCYGLRYMLAVLDEGLRMYPPVPTGFTRIVPGDGEVMSGRFVPGGVSDFCNYSFVFSPLDSISNIFTRPWYRCTHGQHIIHRRTSKIR